MLMPGLMTWLRPLRGSPIKTSSEGEAEAQRLIIQTAAFLIRARRRRAKPKAMPAPKMGIGPGLVTTGYLESAGSTCI